MIVRCSDWKNCKEECSHSSSLHEPEGQCDIQACELASVEGVVCVYSIVDVDELFKEIDI